MKAHLIDTHPGTKVKVICKDHGQISVSCFSKDGCFGGISVSQTHLVQQCFLKPFFFYSCGCLDCAGKGSRIITMSL